MSRAAALLQRPFVAALLGALWMAAFLPVPSSWPALALSAVAVVLCASSMGLARSYLYVSAFLLLCSAVVCVWLLATPYGEIELLLPVMYVLFYLGRCLDPVWIGPVSAVCFGTTVGAREGAPWYGPPLFFSVCFAGWALGRIVRNRAREAVEATRRSADLARVDLEREMAKSALEGRKSATSASLTVLRGAVERMATMAVRIRETGIAGWSEPATKHNRAIEIDAIRREGERAIAELHAILAQLDGQSRSKSTERAPAPASPPSPKPLGFKVERMPWLMWSAGACLTFASVALALLFAGPNIPLLVAAFVIPVFAWLANRLPVLSGVGAGAACVLAVAGDDFPPDVLLPVGVGYSILVWSLTGNLLRDFSEKHRRVVAVSLLVSIGGAALLGAQFGKQGVGFVLALAVIVAGAAAAWQEREAILQTELAKVHTMTAAIAAAKSRADREVRQSVARELHDGVSHGITAMTLQTQAAEAYSSTDPERSCLCMDLAIEIGGHTLREIDALTSGASAERATQPLLATLLEGVEAAGLRVEARLEGTPEPLSYRIVQEALTNIIRYAPGAHVLVESFERDGRRTVRVVDSGAAPAAEQRAPFSHRAARALDSVGRGTGLQNLAQRVSQRGGTFTAVPRRDRGRVIGFEVFAAWPYEPAPASSPSGRPEMQHQQGQDESGSHHTSARL